MQSVSSNAVADAISYSETEHQVGYWIDGSPLYERTVQVNVPQNGNYTINYPSSHKVKVWSGNFFQGSIANPEWVMHIPYNYLEGSPVTNWIMIYVYANPQTNYFALTFSGGGIYAGGYFGGVAVITYKYTKS